MTTLRVIDGIPSESLTQATARRLRGQLAERKITNRGLGRMIGKSYQWVNRRADGETSMSAEDMELIEAATGISAVYLVSGIQETPRPNGPRGGNQCATRDSNPQPSDPKVVLFSRNANLPKAA